MNGPGADPSAVTGLVIMTDLWEVWQPHLNSPQVSSYSPGPGQSGVRRPSLAPQTHSGTPLDGRPLLGSATADENVCDQRILQRSLCPKEAVRCECQCACRFLLFVLMFCSFWQNCNCCCQWPDYFWPDTKRTKTPCEGFCACFLPSDINKC